MSRFFSVAKRYLVFFLLIAFLTTCCLSLFSVALARSLHIQFQAETISLAAKLTFGNVIVLSLLFTVMDAVRRDLIINRSVRHILDAAEKIIAGDFSVRVAPISRFSSDESFNQIIACFNRMAQELASVETLRTDFIANVSHELKTPLAAMSNYATLLQSPALTQAQRMDYAKAIVSRARQLSRMMTNILKLNKLDNQQIYPQAQTYDLSGQLCQCLLQFESVWEENAIDLDTQIPDQVLIHADQELLELVWNNLLSNAFKFTPAGGQVQVQLSASSGHIQVCIQDTGCGMSPQTLSHIFEKFYQGDTSHATQGNGLGLALVKRVVDILGGTIQVQSAPGQGTRFTVCLPAVLPTA